MYCLIVDIVGLSKFRQLITFIYCPIYSRQNATNYNMVVVNVKVALILALAGLSSAELMCEDCEIFAQISSEALKVIPYIL